MDRKLGILANSEELKASIEKIYGEDIREGKIIIDILDSERIDEQGVELEKKGAKAIIARTGGYRHTLGKVNVPVVNFKLYIQDILHAIRKAEKYKKEIVLILSDLVEFDYKEWKGFINSKLSIEWYYSVDEIEKVVEKYKGKQTQVVIVAGGIPCKHARQYDLDCVTFEASEETIHDIISRAWEIIDNLYEQKYRNNILKNILDQVHDAVVAIDNEEKIILYNERAEELLKKDRKYVINFDLKEVFPELGFIVEVLRSKNKFNGIVNLKNIVTTVNSTLLELDGQIVGSLCTFQDITKLQGLEKKVRFELNKKGLTARHRFDDLLAFDPAMKRTLVRAADIGMSDSTAMLYGESGTGKEMIAQSIHNISKRSKNPFVAVNCAALTESLLESELFGYEEGAFTGARKGGKPGLFELAHGGTIFLDEINSIPINVQTKLLRVLEEKEVMRIGSDYVIPLDVRILAAANEDLRDKINDGSFRNDLFYRLSILELDIPPLRKRKDDIIPLFKHFLTYFAKSKNIPEINSDLENKLLSYSWPGNVRELRNIAERYILLGEVEIPDIKTLAVDNSNDSTSDNSEKMRDFCLNLKEIDRYVELKVIDMLEKQGMAKNEIANVLGISRASLWSKIKNAKDESEN